MSKRARTWSSSPTRRPSSGHLAPGDEVLDQHLVAPLRERRHVRLRQDRRDPPEGGDELARVVGPDHAPAAGEDRRLQDTRIRDAPGGGLRVVGDVEEGVARGPDTGPGERLPHPVLVPRRLDGGERARAKAEPLRDGRGDHRGAVVDGNHRVHPVPASELRDRPRALPGVPEVERQEVVREAASRTLGRSEATTISTSSFAAAWTKASVR